MKFGLFFELQIPRPWGEGAEQRLFNEVLEQVELGDRIGLDYVWAPEHHFLEEFSHSSAPEVFLAACAQRTQRMRLGHGIVLMPPNYNHPARVAERIATLDLVSNGRVDFGTGESASSMELHGFRVPVEEKHAMWEECVEQVCNMLTMSPYPGYDGKYFSMPCRDLVPKPAQRPHPPLWMACTQPRTVELAAKLGMGALVFAFNGPDDAKSTVDLYYSTLKESCVPIGHAVNPNIAMVSGFSCHPSEDEAVERGLDGFRFFGYCLQHYYVFGEHTPGRTQLWKRYEEIRNDLPNRGARSGLGTPAQLREYLRGFSDAKVDQIILIQQGGRNRHEHICEALTLFADEVMPEFKEREDLREKQKLEELAPYIEKAFERKARMRPLGDDEIPVVHAKEGKAGRQARAFGAGLAPRRGEDGGGTGAK
jgi:alkanesulfonate monooxygenase SsuD/methylene tetrahydromethanopterin reductase-like flavin-dependent oxidoreductase (luciferase family)